MVALIVAFIVQVVWEVVRAVLLQTVVSPRNGHVAALGFAVTVATALIAAVASADLGRRLSGRRRLGIWIAAGAYVVIAACLAVREGFALVAHDSAGAVAWIMWMYRHGWCVLDVIAVTGFAMAAGRAGLWLGPPAVGLAVAGERPAFLDDPWALGIAIALLAARMVLLVAMAAVAERSAVRAEPTREQAQRGLRLGEIVSWISAVTSLTWALPGFSTSSERIAIVMVTIWFATSGICVVSAWSLAQSRVREIARWPLYLAAVCVLVGMLRLLRSWFPTFIRHWGHWDEAHFSLAHWSTEVTPAMASACTVAVLVVLARRTRSREALAAAILYGASSFVLYALRFSVPEIRALMAACFVVANVLAARAYRAAGTSLNMGLPRARAL